MSAKIKVLVVDDSAYTRQTIRRMLENDPEIEVIAVATDGLDAMSKTIRLSPDLITLDFEMPEMDGFTFLRWVMRERPTPVIMVSSNTETSIAFKALELGAMDFVTKPTRRASVELENIERDLVAKVKAARSLNLDALHRTVQMAASTETSQPSTPLTDIEVVAIGSSTGGPTALQQILTRLPNDLPAAVVISQHMPKGFTGPLADRLNKVCTMRIKEAEDGDVLQKGHAYICPGGSHMVFKGAIPEIKVKLLPGVNEDKYVPSVDRMMLSIADICDHRILGVVLTGMGNDGKEGMVRIKGLGGITIAESEETAVVFGMPREVVEAGAAQTVLPLDKIAPGIISTLIGDRRGTGK